MDGPASEPASEAEPQAQPAISLLELSGVALLLALPTLFMVIFMLLGGPAYTRTLTELDKLMLYGTYVVAAAAAGLLGGLDALRQLTRFAMILSVCALGMAGLLWSITEEFSIGRVMSAHLLETYLNIMLGLVMVRLNIFALMLWHALRGVDGHAPPAVPAALRGLSVALAAAVAVMDAGICWLGFRVLTAPSIYTHTLVEAHQREVEYTYLMLLVLTGTALALMLSCVALMRRQTPVEAEPDIPEPHGEGSA